MSIAPRAWFSYGATASSILAAFGVGGTPNTALSHSSVISKLTKRSLLAAGTEELLTDYAAFDGSSWQAPVDAGISRSRSTGAMPSMNGGLMLIGGQTDASASQTGAVLTFNDPSAPPSSEEKSSEHLPTYAVVLVIIGAFVVLLAVALISRRRQMQAKAAAMQKKSANDVLELPPAYHPSAKVLPASVAMPGEETSVPVVYAQAVRLHLGTEAFSGPEGVVSPSGVSMAMPSNSSMMHSHSPSAAYQN